MFVHRRYAQEQREETLRLVRAGIADREIARRTGVARSTVRNWRLNGIPARYGRLDPLPAGWRPSNTQSYAYLLGLYLGDGHIGRHGRSTGIDIYLDLAHPGIVQEATEALGKVFSTAVHSWVRPGTNCVRLTSYGPHWPRAFPQHGPGPKHLRKIELVDWQQAIVEEYPREFLRGLIHSDGCRCVNEFTVQLKNGPKRYRYVRYFFSNLSEDIREIFCESCELLGIRWSMSNRRNVSVSDRRSVELLDLFIGPKT